MTLKIAEGVDPRWVRSVGTAGGTWHVLDNQAVLDREPVGTLLCVHGNPTSSYLWRHVIAELSTGDRPWRVIAMDQLNMGWSSRTGRRRLGQRLADLGALTDELGIEGPVVTLGHDWGGCISLGWAVNHRADLAGVAVLNTAVHQPGGSALPFLIATARLPGLRRLVTATTPIFLQGTLAIAHPQLSPAVRAGYLDPYRGASRRGGIDEFVEDIPVNPEHPSWSALQGIVEGLPSLSDLPALMLWGPRDPVFTDLYLRDLRSRLPQAKVHRFEKAGHLVAEDAEVARAVRQWLEDDVEPRLPGSPAVPSPGTTDGLPEVIQQFLPGEARRSLWAPLETRAQDLSPALVEPTGHGNGQIGSWRTTTWMQLSGDVHRVAAGLTASGVKPGDRVALLVPPGADLTVALYACLRIGAVAVIADAGLGLPGLHRAIRGSAVKHVIGIDRGLLAARALRWPGQKISVGIAAGSARAKALGAGLALEDLKKVTLIDLPPAPAENAEAMVIFTSGSTGPAKGVVYTHRQLEGVRDALLSAYKLRTGSDNPYDDDRFVAAFAPFALFGPGLGVPSVVPAMDVTAPRTLTASALAQAARALDATVVFASPAALTNVLATSSALSADDRSALTGVRLLLSAGAPVPAELLTTLQGLLPQAELHTPYGMTEALLLTDVDLPELVAAGPGNGVLVGRPMPGVEIRISPLAADGRASRTETTAKTAVTGEILVRAPHLKERYDQLWLTQRETSTTDGWHRTGDVGHFDADGRLWVEGRLIHVIRPAGGFVTPYGVEQRIQTVPGVRRAALVGIGQAGAHQLVAVVEAPDAELGVAPLELAAAVRAAAGLELVAVLVTDVLKTDIRHNSKIDRDEVGRRAAALLAGSRSS